MDTRQKNQAADPAALISTSSLSEHYRDASHEFLAAHPTMEPSPNKPNTREKQNENTSQASQSSRSHLTKEPSTKPSKETSPARKWKCMAQNSGFKVTSSFGPNPKFKRQRVSDKSVDLELELKRLIADHVSTGIEQEPSNTFIVHSSHSLFKPSSIKQETAGAGL